MRVTDDHYRRVIRLDPEAAQNVAQCAAALGGNKRDPKAEIPVIPEGYGGLLHCTDVK
jgi:hypothetical protein